MKTTQVLDRFLEIEAWGWPTANRVALAERACKIAKDNPDEWTGDEIVRVLGKACKCTQFKYDTELIAAFDFGGSIDQGNFPSVSPAQQKKFEGDFVKQFKLILAELFKHEWLAPDAPLPPRVTSGAYRAQSDFHVAVSEDYTLAKSLVPAWSGQRGWMEFPAHRVVAGEASIAHEIVHVLLPNGNRMLAEGLATYLQHKFFPSIPVYPNFGYPLEQQVGDFLATTRPFSNSAPDALWHMDLDGLAKISTPDELSLRIGKYPILARPGEGPPPPEELKFIYAVSGSLVAFLLENPIGYPLLTETNFRALYQSTPLRPLERDPGDPNRWQRFYRGKNISYSFKDLGLLWKTYMHVNLFSGGEHEIPIPRDYRGKKLVVELYDKLKGVAGRTPAKRASGPPPRKRI